MAPKPTEASTPSLVGKLAQGVAWMSGFYSRPQVIQRSARLVYNRIVEQGVGDQFHELCRLPDTFQSWFLVTQLHLWMCLVRFKADGSDGVVMYKQLVTLFWNDVEYRMKIAGVWSCWSSCPNLNHPGQ